MRNSKTRCSSTLTTRICFRSGDADARKSAEGFCNFEAEDIRGLPIGEAIVRLGETQNDFNIRVVPTPTLDPAIAVQKYDELLTLSARQFGPPAITGGLPAGPARTALVPHPQNVGEDFPSKPVREQPPPNSSPAPETSSSLPGRGGREHKYLQQLIKRLGEERGFRATIEASLKDHSGQIDVLLEQEGMSIAFEVSVSTPAEHEREKLRKCLSSGYSRIAFLVSKGRGAQARFRNALMEGLSQEEKDRTTTLTPEELPDYNRGICAAARPYQIRSSRVIAFAFRMRPRRRKK